MAPKAKAMSEVARLRARAAKMEHVIHQGVLANVLKRRPDALDAIMAFLKEKDMVLPDDEQDAVAETPKGKRTKTVESDCSTPVTPLSHGQSSASLGSPEGLGSEQEKNVVLDPPQNGGGLDGEKLPRKYQCLADLPVHMLVEIMEGCEEVACSAAQLKGYALPGRKIINTQRLCEVLSYMAEFDVSQTLPTHLRAMGPLKAHLVSLNSSFGRRLRDVKHPIDWAQTGHFFMTFHSGSCWLHDRLEHKRVLIPGDMLKGIDVQALVVENNLYKPSAFVSHPTGAVRVMCWLHFERMRDDVQQDTPPGAGERGAALEL
jgi:hypothetical protein